MTRSKISFFPVLFFMFCLIIAMLSSCSSSDDSRANRFQRSHGSFYGEVSFDQFDHNLVDDIKKEIVPSTTRAELEIVDYYDSLEHVVIDTTTLEGKMDYIERDEILNHALNLTGDTIIDINFDSYPDYILKYYGAAGSGLKNRSKVYVFNASTREFELDSVLSDLPNLSFYQDEMRITSFYLPFGSGYCSEYQWTDTGWTLSKSITVLNQGRSTTWEVLDEFTNTKEDVKLPYQMIPPKELLSHNY